MTKTKKELVENIINGLDINFFHSKEILLDLAEEALNKKTIKELLDLWENEV